jgi:hypothetical protein
MSTVATVRNSSGWSSSCCCTGAPNGGSRSNGPTQIGFDCTNRRNEEPHMVETDSVERRVVERACAQ